jgi:predicted TIM-barrel enzyme
VIAETAWKVSEEILILGHGGPLNSPESAADILQSTGIDGYAAGSTGERIPVVDGVSRAISQYKAIKLT